MTKPAVFAQKQYRQADYKQERLSHIKPPELRARPIFRLDFRLVAHVYKQETPQCGIKTKKCLHEC